MPDNKNPPENHQPLKPEDDGKNIGRLFEEKECQESGCKKFALSLSSYCWKHTKDKEGYRKKIEDWARSRKSMKWFVLTGARLSELNLEEVNLSWAELNEANISGAKLKRAKLVYANLEGANLSWAELDCANMSLAKMKGAKLCRAKLEGAKLKKAELYNSDLSGAELFGANLAEAKLNGAILSNANLDQANLSDTFLIETNLSNASLMKANLSRAMFDETNLSGARLFAADLSGADLRLSVFSKTWLTGANLTNANLSLAILTNAMDLSKENFSDELTDKEKKDAFEFKESYLTVKNYFIQSGLYDDASWAAFRERTLERIALAHEIWEKGLKGLLSWSWWKSSFRWFGFKIISLLNGYGERPLRAVISSLAIVIFFSIIHFLFNWIQANPPEVLHWWDYLYFSIVTFTTLGYGDIRPMAAPGARMVASGEAFIGAFMIALFVWTLARRYVAR